MWEESLKILIHIINYAIHSDISPQVFKASIFLLYRLFVEKLPKHPDYKSAPVNDVTGIKKVSPQHTPVCQCFVKFYSKEIQRIIFVKENANDEVEIKSLLQRGDIVHVMFSCFRNMIYKLH